MNDEEIKKALECCGCDERKSVCNECPIRYRESCLDDLPKIALDLINRQQAEIEKSAENNKAIMRTIADVRENAIKEFAERLKSKYINVVSCNAGYVYGTIKEVEKEMVGGENA